LSEDIKAKQEKAKETEKLLDDTRATYWTVARHASEIFFCISSLGSLEPMYQYSLNWYMNLYVHVSVRIIISACILIILPYL
jgi:dynein heavy chain, axonemal